MIRLPLAPILLAPLLIAGCGLKEGSLSTPNKVDLKVAMKPYYLHYAPKPGQYRYVSTTITNAGAPDSHTSQLEFNVTVTRKADRYTAVATIVSATTDGEPRVGITESMLRDFRLTSIIDPHGVVMSSSGVGTAPFVGKDAKDMGTNFELPSGPLKPGDTWQKKLNGFTLTFKFDGVDIAGGQALATFEETASGNGKRDDIPTMITVDADSGVVLEKSVSTEIPSGPDPNAPLVPVSSDLRLENR